MHDSDKGFSSFLLHVDDGCGGWATNWELAEELHQLLEKTYPGIKWSCRARDGNSGGWHDQLGFAVERDFHGGYTTITAPKHIKAVQHFVEGDVKMTPKTPSNQSIMDLKPIEIPEEGTAEHVEFLKDRDWLQSANGCAVHITKVRQETVPTVVAIAKCGHAPGKDAIAAMKWLLFYLLGTINTGLKIGAGPDANVEMLEFSEELHGDYVLNPEKKLLGYHAVIDGDLRVNDRSVSGVLHMLGGTAFAPFSFRQHSAAISAHDSEVFSASSCVAHSIFFRDHLVALGIDQSLPTPIFSDSKSTLLTVQNDSSLKRALHTTRRVYFMQEARMQGEVSFFTVPGKVNPADIFTKWVRPPIFLKAVIFFTGMAVEYGSEHKSLEKAS